MRDPARMDKVLAAFKQLWEEVPDWRFMQLICNLQRDYNSDMFYVEDDDLEKYFLHLKKLSREGKA